MLRCVQATAAVCLLASALIVFSYARLSHTWDEPTHVAAGLEWLESRHYTFQTENPPLARIAVALVPYLNGARTPPPNGDWTRVPIADVFYRDRRYVANVTEARIANLPIFWIVLLLTWALSGGRSVVVVAALATTLLATLPPVVAHAGLATTDIPFVAAFLFCIWRWKHLIACPDLTRGLWLGSAIGVALATKFSTIAFFPPVAVAMLATRLWIADVGTRTALVVRIARSTVPAIVVACVVVWASYGFRVGRLADLPPTFGPYGKMPTTGVVAYLANVPLPAHEFIHGLLYLRAHARSGHGAYLMGASSQRGFWLFYPVALLVKTPPLTLFVIVAGIAFLVIRRRDKDWATFAGYALGGCALLAVAACSTINLGVRHVLAVYPLLVMSGAFGVVRALETVMPAKSVRTLASCLVLGQALCLTQTFPNQLAYFNRFAGSDPGWVLSDSDLEWGQDVLALERYFARHPVDRVYFVGNGSALWCRHKLPRLTPLPREGSVTGWVVVFERPYRMNSRGPMIDVCGNPIGSANTAAVNDGWLDWLYLRQPAAWVGAGVRVYYL